MSNGRHSAKTLALPSVSDLALGKGSRYAECLRSGTRQSPAKHGVLPSADAKALGEGGALPSVFPLALGKAISQQPENGRFAECQGKNTR